MKWDFINKYCLPNEYLSLYFGSELKTCNYRCLGYKSGWGHQGLCEDLSQQNIECLSHEVWKLLPQKNSNLTIFFERFCTNNTSFRQKIGDYKFKKQIDDIGLFANLHYCIKNNDSSQIFIYYRIDIKNVDELIRILPIFILKDKEAFAVILDDNLVDNFQNIYFHIDELYDVNSIYTKRIEQIKLAIMLKGILLFPTSWWEFSWYCIHCFSMK